jgi:hypothetical protein
MKWFKRIAQGFSPGDSLLSKLFGNDSARQRFVREARAAASVRRQNVASVFHIGESAGDYYYAMVQL